ncbi:BolA-like protein [Diplonema papillatum]|nr:BolA-like protein [Diplonema papillatum]|eukprot:gene18488-28534_t
MFRACRRLLAVSAEHLEERLVSCFPGSKVVVDDVSGGCGASFTVRVESAAFVGKSLPTQHKMVVASLKGASSDANFPANHNATNFDNLFVDDNGQEHFHALSIKTVTVKSA